MSGGSFNYLFQQDEPEVHELRAMANELHRRGMDEAEDATLALIRQPSPELRALWHAVEWHVSCDWSEADVARAYVKFLDCAVGVEVER